MNIILPHTAHRIPLIFVIVLLFGILNVNAQRLEVHANKDLSTNTIATKAWGVGGAVDLDEWVNRMIFRPHFNWAMYRKKDWVGQEEIPEGTKYNHNYQRFSGGFSALYSFKAMERLTFLCGAELNYTNLRHSFINAYDTVSRKPVTFLQVGNFIGIGPQVSLQYELSSRFNLAFNFIPTYLIPVSSRTTIRTIESDYKKGVWLFQVQLGLSYKLFRPD